MSVYVVVRQTKLVSMGNLIFMIVLACISTFSTASDQLSEAELKQKAEAFINAKNDREQSNATIVDIDNYISFLADEFVDEHIKFNVTITSKEELRKGMIAKLANKVYFSDINIDQLMIGHNVVFVKYTEHAKVKPFHMDKIVEFTSTNIISLEFNKDGLIKHIRRHHGL